MFDLSLPASLNFSSLPAVTIAADLSRDLDDLVVAVYPGRSLAVVCDDRTADALGNRLCRALAGRYAVTPIRLKGVPKADEVTAEYISAKSKMCDALIAVGSGTINDLCKYVSARATKPYIVFPTAASMNGYVAANASISVDGYKKTMPAKIPLAVFCDMSVIANAPARLSKSGLGDSLARPTAQADWLLSHWLLGTPYDETPFDLLKTIEPQLFEQARGIALADRASITLLMRLLLLSGLGMTIAGGSFPASGGEHMIAHAMGMLPNTPRNQFHGEEIGITTLAMAELQERLLRSKPVLHDFLFPAEKIMTLYGAEITKSAEKMFAAKKSLLCHPERSFAQDNIMANWEAIAEKIASSHISPARLRKILEQAQAPTVAAAIGWDAQDYVAATQTARYLRERVTFLDIK